MLGCLTLHISSDVRVSVERKRSICVSQNSCKCFGINSSGYSVRGKSMPLRYNNDKPEKPRNFKGLEVYQADFSSFSNPKNQATKPLFRRGC